MPECEMCGKSGAGVEFNIFGPFEFGKYCVPCEKIMVLGAKPEPISPKKVKGGE